MSDLNSAIERAIAQELPNKPSVSTVRFGKPTAGRVPTSSAKAKVLPNADMATLYDSFPKTPSASESGAQEGVVPPAQRRSTAHYEPVDMATAMERARARMKGELPAVAGGMNDEHPHEPSGSVLDTDAPARPISPVPSMDELLVESTMPAPRVEHPLMVVRPKSKRVNMMFDNGVYSIPCMDVKESPTGLMILLPLDPEGGTFYPKAGGRFEVGVGTKTWKVFYPGLCFELPEYGAVALALLLDTSEGA